MRSWAIPVWTDVNSLKLQFIDKKKTQLFFHTKMQITFMFLGKANFVSFFVKKCLKSFVALINFSPPFATML